EIATSRPATSTTTRSPLLATLTTWSSDAPIRARTRRRARGAARAPVRCGSALPRGRTPPGPRRNRRAPPRARRARPARGGSSAGRAGPRPRARCLDLHARDEAVDLRLLRNQLGEGAAETERVLAERRSHPVVTGGRGVALVEDEVDDLEHRRQTGGELGAAGDLEGDALLGESPLGPDDALGDGRLRDEERPRDLLGRQTAEQAECERHARLGREHRMTRYEHEAQEVVANVVVDRRVEIRCGHLLLGLDLATELLVLALAELASAKLVDRAMPRSGH